MSLDEAIADLDDGELNHEGLPDDFKEAGAIPVSLKDVKNSIGRDREGRRIAIDAELNSLKETNSIQSITEIQKNSEGNCCSTNEACGNFKIVLQRQYMRRCFFAHVPKQVMHDFRGDLNVHNQMSTQYH